MTDCFALVPKPVRVDPASPVVTRVPAGKYVTKLLTPAMHLPATRTESARRAKIAITARTIVGKKPRGIRTADTAATATCPIVAMRGVPRKDGFAVTAFAEMTAIAMTANSATVPRPALVGAARVVAIHAQAKAAMRLPISAWTT